jgi:ubiquitin carboxyl-terminal hydrolase 48
LAPFYELSIGIETRDTLENHIKKMLSVEQLQGDNQYMCTNCNSKQDATRKTKLSILPKVFIVID